MTITTRGVFAFTGMFAAVLLGLTASAQAQAVNLIPNGSLETASGAAPANWTFSYWGTPVPSFKYPVAGNSGSKAASITLTANSTGGAYWRTTAPVTVTAGKSYTYTAWYNSNVATEIDAEYKTSNGAVSYAFLASVPSSGGVWKQITVKFTVPSGKTKVTVYHLITKKGAITIDDISLAPTTTTPPSPTVTITASPASVTNGQSSTLSWSSANATTCTASNGWSGTKAISGTQVVTPTATTTYALTCSGTGTTTSQVTVNVVPAPVILPPQLTLTASATSLVSGQSTNLNWNGSNVTTCTASGGWTGSKVVSGTQAITPTATTTYSLSCTGSGGSVSRSVTINVSVPPPSNPGIFTEGMVTLSFDDSWISQYSIVLPILQSAGMKGTFYLTTQPIQEGWTDFMTPAQTQAIAAQGHEIAGHTVTHPHMPTLTSTQIANEIGNSKTYLQNLTGKTVVSFAYPFGEFNATVKSLVQLGGYTSARGVEEDSLNTAQSDKYDLKSSCIELSATIASIKAQIDKARANKEWYILCIHEVKTGGDQYSITPSTFQQIVDYIKQTGVKVVTVAEGRALMAN